MKTKKLFKIPALSILALSVTLLSSCLKDTRYVDYAGATPMVELPLVASAGAFQAQAYPIQSTPIDLPLVINLASPSTLGSATTVTLKIDQAALDAYNTANTTTFVLFPAADYTVSSLTATIPAGQRTATVHFMINSSLIDLTKQFILPVSIASGGGVTISSYSTILYNIQAKNKYDGIWNVTGTMVDNGNSAITGKYPVKYYLETQGATTDGMYDYNYAGAFGHEILSGTSTSYYGSFGPVFTFDASNNITAVVNFYGQPAGNGRSAALDPTGTNKFTSGTPGTAGATFQVSYVMNQPSVVPVGPRVTFNETWTYVGPRP